MLYLKKIICVVNTGLFVMLLCFSLAYASSQKVPSINAQRLILNSKKGSLLIHNGGDLPWLFQSLVEMNAMDNIDRKGNEKIIKSMIFPEVARLHGNSEFKLSVSIPDDASIELESLYWLTVRFIPAKYLTENVLTFPVAYRVKVFYRPPLLANQVPDPCSLKWESDGDIIRVTNNTQFHFSLSRLNFEHDSFYLPTETVLMPKSNHEFKKLVNVGQLISFNYMADEGKIETKEINCVSM
ncbi:fimbria/pilus periplasmic chaperone [Raoultella planticola]|uniref:fimbrial biogenesis chaperone n=1 Tax=Raoultella planticola TaxID=575 RepID=UPI0010F02F8B|nr:fimbria/pilus periplasmic chaperone [Raoultella planticola]VTM72929.1 Chaperone protein fimC precursor [Raoultella planticola]HDH7823032.1 molecular chaperone [Raoultella planticola]